MTVDAQFPQKLKFLFEPHPYKIVHGGRDGLKSWSFARALLLMGAQYKIRWLCARETMQSISESVHQLLEEQIGQLGLHGAYRVEKARIVGTMRHKTGMYGRPIDEPGYSEFVFAGLRHNVNQIKSFEGLDGVWVEEAANVSKNSWTVVIPTIRKEGSEIWISFNAELVTDDTYQRWVVNPPPGAVVCKTTYRDNKWLTESSQAKIDHMRATDPETFDNVYEGNPTSTVHGAIFGAEIKLAIDEGRVCDVPYNKARPVDTAWDLGFGDLNTIWFLQVYDGWYNFIDYEQGQFLSIADWIVKLQQKSYVYGTDWLPHDGVDTIIHHRLGGVGNANMSIEMLMRAAGRKVRLAPKLLVPSRINAGRTIFSRCRFDKTKCQDGLQALSHYAWESAAEAQKREQDRDRPLKRMPLHNWASHGADGFQTAAVAIREPAMKAEEKKREIVQPPTIPGEYSPYA